MKKLKSLGKLLSKTEMKKVIGGDYGNGCTATYGGCNYSYSNGLTCDYFVSCSDGFNGGVCYAPCQGSDGSGCIPTYYG
jgi:hypothetical protein